MRGNGTCKGCSSVQFKRYLHSGKAHVHCIPSFRGSPALCVKHVNVCPMNIGPFLSLMNELEMLRLAWGCITIMLYSLRYSPDFRSTPTCVHGIRWTQQCRFVPYQCIHQTWVAVCVDLFANLFLKCLHEENKYIKMMFVKLRIYLFIYLFQFYWQMKQCNSANKVTSWS